MERRKPTRPIPAASAAVIQGNSVLLVRRKVEPNLDLWAFPGGAIELGEHARDAARREVLEETGIETEIDDLADYVEIIEPEGSPEPEYHYLVLCFQAHPISGTLQAATDAEEAAWVPIPEALKRNLTPGTRAVLGKILGGNA